MAFKDELKRLRKQDGLTQAELSSRLGIAKSTISMYECGNREPDFETLELFADFFNVDMNRLIGREDTVASALPPVSSAGHRIAVLYDRANDRDRGIVETILEPYDDGKIVVFPASEKIIPLLGTAPAAGPGEFDTGLPWEEYTVPADSRADFAVRISGDSMEPELTDGQIALCVEKTPQIGELAIMMVNGSLFVKQYIRDNYGNVYLRSLNRDRKDCDYDIKASGNDTVQCYGTVITARRIPLVTP